MKIDKIYFSYKQNQKTKNIAVDLEKKGFENEDLNIVIESNENKFKAILKPKSELEIEKFYLIINNEFKRDERILINGYQTWSETKEYKCHERQKDFPFLLKPIIDRYKIKYLGDYTIYKYSNKKGVLHSYGFTYIRDEDNYKFIGSLNEDSGFTIIEHNTTKNIIKIIKDCSGRMVNDQYELMNIIFLNGDENVFDSYFKELKIKPKTDKLITGWTSWYNYYTDISEEIILENLKAFEKQKIKIDYFQIDDGYQNSTGDWLIIKEQFPNGMKYIADEIKKRGYEAGLWLAPFICSEHSRLFKEHKEFLLKDEKGRPLPAGYSDVWNGDFYVLDFYNNDFRDYLKTVFDTVLNKWGFDMVKLDFLYAVALYPRKEKTRGEIMAEAMEYLTTLIGDKKILGCGVPLNSAFGRVDYCRIGSDVGLKWEDKKLKFINYRERISTICAIKDSIFRRSLNFKAFINDPDVFLLRDENIFLNYNQKYTLFLLNLIFGGLVFTSDNINNYTEEKLFLYKSHFPFKKKENIKVIESNNIYKITFKIDYVQYTVYSNLNNSTYEISEKEDLFFYGVPIKKGTPFNIEPYQSLCFVNITDKDFEIVGSNGHIFGGSEVDSFEISNNNINLKINKNTLNHTSIFIKIPSNLDGYNVNNKFIKAENINDYKIIKAEML